MNCWRGVVRRVVDGTCAGTVVDVRRTREHLERANHLNDVILHFVSFNGELTTVVVVIFIVGDRKRKENGDITAMRIHREREGRQLA